MPVIPMTRELRETIGEFAEKVSNRSLLLDKFVLPKQDGTGEKFHDASRLSLLRISSNAEHHLNALVSRDESVVMLAKKLAATKCDSGEALRVRKEHSLRLLRLVEKSFGERAEILVATLESRLAINLATGVIQNGGISLDPLSGLPVIPGSAVKGLARRAAVDEIRNASLEDKTVLEQRFAAIFGTAENNDRQAASGAVPIGAGEKRGAVTFLPAYPVNDAHIEVDLTNVHYPDYYRSGKLESLRQEKPQPNPFPVVARGAAFGFALTLNGIAAAQDEPALLAQAREWLVIGLTLHGLGAKTGSGYGWFKLDDSLLEALRKEVLVLEKKDAEAALKRREERLRQEESERKKNSADPISKLIGEYEGLDDQKFADVAKTLEQKSFDEQLAFIRTLLENKAKREKLKAWKKKDNAQAKAALKVAAIPEIKAIIDPISKKLNLPQFP